VSQADILKKPCPGCPFSRKTDPKYLKSRGEDVRRFIGQSVGPFLLPCHTFADKEDWPLDVERPQCVGAAMHRDLIGVADSLPEQLTRATGDAEEVFESSAAYMAYHDGCTVEEAVEKLDNYPVNRLFYDEIARCHRSGRKVKA